jgi:hypothetical protein
MIFIASSTVWKEITGRIGPKISSFIRGESLDGFRITVGRRL